MFEETMRMSLTKTIMTLTKMLRNFLVVTFAITTTLAVFVPLNPRMPLSGLDPSWAFSMNEAVAQNLSFGKDIIFTFGPYAAIYTQLYHPATDHLMVFGSLFLALCYSVALLYLARGGKLYRLLAFLVFLSGFMYLRDALLFSYPLILAACVSKFITETDQQKGANLNHWQILVIFLVFAPLGLLSLIKGTLLLICGATTTIISIYLLYHNYRKLVLIALISPVASTVIFWMLSGQPISSLPNFFINLLPIIFGYTEAMAWQGNHIEIIFYLIASTVIIRALIKSNGTSVQTKIFLALCFALFLFIAFKGGFVRHGDHAIMSGTSIVIASFIIGFLYPNKHFVTVLLISLVAWAFIDKTYVNTSTKQAFENIRNTYVNAWNGLYLRASESNNLLNRFERHLDEIRKEYAIPKLQGTVDIYSYDQAYLLASSNKWNPRPIIQSYSVYTPKLALLNEQHLRGINAPDNVLFRVQPIDGRLPSLEDGLSWPALFDNYKVTKLDNDFAYLLKKQTIYRSSAFDVIYEGTHKIGEEVSLPITSAPIVAEIDLKLTLLGKFLEFIFKPPRLKITLKLKNGTIKDYRVISKMMQSGFFISPLVWNTSDFLLLATGNHHYLKNLMIESFVIAPSFGGSIFWSNTYKLRLKAYQRDGVTAVPENFFDKMSDSIPGGIPEYKTTHCEGSIDIVNEFNPPPASQSIKVDNLLHVSGWLAVSTKDGLAPDEVFVTLKKFNEVTKYIKAKRTPRNDVKAYFRQPAMPDVGYSATIDVTKLDGEYVLGLARAYNGKLEQCQQLKTVVSIGTAN